MKVIHIAGGGDRGGAKPHIIQLCSRLSREHDIKLVSMRSGDFPKDAEEAGINTVTLFSGFAPLDYIRLIRFVRREKPDVVHCHGAKANVGGVLVKLFCRRTIVTTIHSDYRLDYLHSALRRNTIGRINAAALRRFDYYTTVSDQFRKMMIERGFCPLDIMTIYNGVDFSKTAAPFDRGEYLRSHGLDYKEGDIVLGIPARLTPVKDIPTLLRAFRRALDEQPNVRLIIGGDGEELQNLKKQAAALSLDDKVSFFGWVSDVPQFFAACDINVLCSISESFPYSILEGIREGCAVITSDVGGMRQLVRHGESGYIFNPGDDGTFAGYIIELARDNTKRRLFAERLHADASARYSLDSMAATQSGIYSRILELEKRAERRRDGVLICGAYGRGNSGDEAILNAIIHSMRELDPLMPLTVMTRQPKQTRLKHGVNAVYTFNPAFIGHMSKAALFVNGGGSLIQDSTSSRSLYFYLMTIFAAKKLGCKVLMYGCGIGPVSGRLNRRISSGVLDRNVDIITLRDAVSREDLQNMGVSRPDIRDAADPAMSLQPADMQLGRAFMAAHGIDADRPSICFSIRNWKGFDSFDIFAEAADYATGKYGMQVVFLPIEKPKDIPPSQVAGSFMKSNYVLLQTPDEVDLTIAILKCMSVVCAMRLHALVFSAAANVPFIAAAYEIKVSSFMNYIGSSACRELNEMNAGWLCAEIDKVMRGDSGHKDVSMRLRQLERANCDAAAELLDLKRPRFDA